MPAGSQYRVVFSYSRIDSDFVLKTASALRNDGVNLWVDQLDIPKGARWDEAVEGAVKDCACMVVVLSPDSVNSPNVLDEVYYALEAKKKVVPVVIRPCEIPFRLKRIQHIDFTAGDSAYAELLAAVENPQAHEQVTVSNQSRGGGGGGGPRLGKVFHLGSSGSSPAADRAPPSGRTDAVWRPPIRPDRRRLALSALAAVVCLSVATPLLLKWRAASIVPPAPVPTVATQVPLPPPDTPSSGATSASAVDTDAAARKLDAQLRQFIADYITLHNRRNVADIMRLYSDKVAYNEEAVDKKVVLDDKTKYYKKWSHVAYRMVEQPTIKPTEDGQQARLSFTLNMAVDGAFGPSQAKVRQHLVVRRVGDQWKIISDRRRVVDKP